MAIKPKYGYYPANFDIEQFCSFYKFKASKVVSILNNFIQNTKKKEFKERQALNAEILKNTIGKDYNKIIAALIDAEVLLHT